MALFAAFSAEANEDLIAAYIIGVGDLSPQNLQVAVVRAVRECERLPRPVELRRLSGERTGDQRALAAWTDLQRAIPLGPYRHVDFADAVINGVVRTLGGWPNVVERFGSAEDEKWLRIEFCKAYQSLESSCADGEVMAPLAGLSEAQVVGGKVVRPTPQRIECHASVDRKAIEDKNRSVIPGIEKMLGRA